MKNKLSIIVLSFLLLAISSCDKEETIDYYEGATPPVLTGSATTVALEPGTESNVALVVNWTNPNYMFTSGNSSHDVTYTIEMDTLGANFASSVKSQAVIAKDLTKSYTVGELNGILGNDMRLQLNPRRNYTMQMRVTAKIGSSVPVVSNVIQFTTKPFAPPPKVAPPASGRLFLVGSATPGGWNNPVPVPSQELTKVDNTHYEIVIALTGAGSYLFLPVNGDWGAKFGGTGSNNTNNVNGDNFAANGGDLLAPAANGNYKIQVDFQLGKFTVTKM